MLTKAFEWCRIVNPQPSTQTVDHRIAAATTIIDALDEEDDWDLMLGCTVGVVAGFDSNFTSDSPVVQTIVSAIRKHDSAFPQDLLENALELRACAGIALGELLIRGSETAPPQDALSVASALRSGLGVRPPHDGKHLRRLLDELEVVASKVLTNGSRANRRRISTFDTLFAKIKEQAPENLPTLWEVAVKPLRSAIEEIVQQSAIDREEINILWWMFAGPSTSTGQSIAELPAGSAVLYCGAELGSRCLLPVLPNHESMVRRAYEFGRKSQALTERSLEKIAAEWDIQVLHALLPDKNARKFAQEHPALVPLSWLCSRLLDSRGATEWADEFGRLTGITASQVRTPAHWAVQAFRERVLYRMLED